MSDVGSGGDACAVAVRAECGSECSGTCSYAAENSDSAVAVAFVDETSAGSEEA